MRKCCSQKQSIGKHFHGNQGRIAPQKLEFKLKDADDDVSEQKSQNSKEPEAGGRESKMSEQL